MTTNAPPPATPMILVNSTISFSISLSSQAVVLFDFILEKIKELVLASVLKTAMTFSTVSVVREIMGKAKKQLTLLSCVTQNAVHDLTSTAFPVAKHLA
ncbi:MULTISPECIES: hypothetical protein [unclassified Halomonas]|uniref:hypothetical protein n=1 Tax=unclassified Halomonas TaxID=2609666 RepID=UPI001CF4566D|nr:MULTISPECIES: hypothetical protein [unclassified Halomonas]MCA8866827.1 hypothetical protein [Halomonas sp. SBBP1]UZH10967.1 hypothetical protein OM794_04215 [Halomonas sp. BDJS001]